MENSLVPTTKQSNSSIVLFTLFFTIFGYVAYLLLYSIVNPNKEYSIPIFLMNWLGIVLGIFILVTWYKLTRTILSPYTIFMLFFFLFNYGQCLLWAFGIHDSFEIGQAPMYRNFGVANDADILKAQALTLICILMFHLGSVLCYKPRKKIIYEETSKTFNAIFYTCLVVGFFVIPITLYYAYYDFKIASVHGYGALYYSEFARTDATIPNILQKAFFPCLVGLLIGSNYKKRVRVTVYTIFTIYFTLNLLSGDRGSWVYKILILIWLSNTCYKRIKMKTLMKYSLIGIGILYITNILVSIRSFGLSNIDTEVIKERASAQSSPFISSIFEMGSSMQPTIILQKYGWDVWPYVSTYLQALLGMVTNKILYLFNIPFELLSSWFSQEYLGISWGAGFSIIAEALLNGGPFLAPLFILIQGYIVTSLISINYKVSYTEKPLRFFFVAATLSIFINITRNELHLVLKDWIYGVLVLYFLIILMENFIFTKEPKKLRGNLSKGHLRGVEIEK